MKSNIDKIVMVQCKAARFVFNDFYRYSSVSNMLIQLNWESLELRRTKCSFYELLIIEMPENWPEDRQNNLKCISLF